MDTKNWSTQIRKGYLELCVLSLIQAHERLYGFHLLKLLEDHKTPIKEGTLYPLLSRMTNDKVLKATWETKNLQGHPRKFYSLTKTGEKILSEMQTEFADMYQNFNKIKNIDTGGKE